MTTRTTQSDSKRFSATGLSRAEGGGVRQGDTLLWDNGHRETILDTIFAHMDRTHQTVARTMMVQADSGRKRLVFCDE